MFVSSSWIMGFPTIMILIARCLLPALASVRIAHFKTHQLGDPATKHQSTMRLLLLVLLVTLVTCPACCEADPPNTNKRLQRTSFTKLVSRGLVANSAFDGDQRFLRGESNKIANNEERSIDQRLMNILKEIKARYLKWEQKILIPKFKELVEEGVTTTKLSDEFWRQTYGFAWFGLPPGYKRFIRLYNTWLKTNHPNLADMNMK